MRGLRRRGYGVAPTTARPQLRRHAGLVQFEYSLQRPPFGGGYANLLSLERTFDRHRDVFASKNRFEDRQDGVGSRDSSYLTTMRTVFHTLNRVVVDHKTPYRIINSKLKDTHVERRQVGRSMYVNGDDERVFAIIPGFRLDIRIEYIAAPRIASVIVYPESSVD